MIRKATPQDIDQVEESYIEFLLHEKEHGAYTVWQLGVYPTRETAEKSLSEGSLYVMEQDGEIYASIIINQDQPVEYDKMSKAPESLLEPAFCESQHRDASRDGKMNKAPESLLEPAFCESRHRDASRGGKINWRCQASQDEVLVIHLLCVRPSKAGHGIGTAMVQFAINWAKKLNCKAVRLDTGPQNKPAVALYTKLGFELAGISAMSIGGCIAHDNHLFYELII